MEIVFSKLLVKVAKIKERLNLFEHLWDRPVKNLLTILSSMGGQLGSTWPAATEKEESDKRAEEARSKQGIYDVDQHLVDDWGQASDGGNGDKEGLHKVYRRWEAFSSM